MIVRKQYKHLSDLIDKSKEWFPKIDKGAVFTSTNMVWRFSSGAEIKFGYIENMSQVEQIQGQEYQAIIIDELGQYTDDKVFKYCLSRLRSSKGIKPYFRATSNPSRYRWLREYFQIPPDGSSTKFRLEFDTANGKTYKTVQYIQATLKDNPYLPKEYEAQLQMLPDDERDALLNGNWLAYDSVEGAVYKKEMSELIKSGRVTTVYPQLGFDVYAAFDLGIGDSTSVILFQICGNEIQIFDSFENNGESINYYINEIKTKGYSQAHIILPHDSNQRSLQTGRTMYDVVKDSFSTVTVLPRLGIEDGISNARSKFKYVYIDKKNERLIECLTNYRRKYNAAMNTFGDPIHDEFSHFADCFRYVCNFTKPQTYDFSDLSKSNPSYSFY